MKIALSIAGSDSGGGAGIQADLKTFHRLGVFGTTVITAVTAQNTLGVMAWESLSPELVLAQIEALATDLPPAAFKSGMLANAAIVDVVARGVAAFATAPYVFDPVMVATSGDPLLEESAIAAIRERLVPLAALVTPNTYEAEILTGAPVRTVADMERAGARLVELGAGAALVKGGHLAGSEATDVLVEGSAAHRFSHPRIETRHTHGTGCTLSAAITAELARGTPLAGAVAVALDYVHRAIATAPGLGAGHGPLNHFA